MGRDYSKSETHWRTLIWEANGRKFYGVDESASLLLAFDPYAGQFGRVERRGAVVRAQA